MASLLVGGRIHPRTSDQREALRDLPTGPYARESHVGRLDRGLDEAAERGWIVGW